MTPIRLRRIIFLAALPFLLLACGQKGLLYLPQDLPDNIEVQQDASRADIQAKETETKLKKERPISE